jgi:hypothetical protein
MVEADHGWNSRIQLLELGAAFPAISEENGGTYRPETLNAACPRLFPITGITTGARHEQL